VKFSFPSTGDWKDRRFLDGEVYTVVTGLEGITLTAGSECKNDAHHMVLWTNNFPVRSKYSADVPAQQVTTLSAFRTTAMVTLSR
jgi:hypothetical protein